MSVVSLAQARAEREPHWAGEAKCVGCGHRWVAVAPMGTGGLECPECTLMKGQAYYPFGAAEGDSCFTCKCGSDALTAYYRGTDRKFFLRCMGCGEDQTSAVFGE